MSYYRDRERSPLFGNNTWQPLFSQQTLSGMSRDPVPDCSLIGHKGHVSRSQTAQSLERALPGISLSFYNPKPFQSPEYTFEEPAYPLSPPASESSVCNSPWSSTYQYFGHEIDIGHMNWRALYPDPGPLSPELADTEVSKRYSTGMGQPHMQIDVHDTHSHHSAAGGFRIPKPVGTRTRRATQCAEESDKQPLLGDGIGIRRTVTPTAPALFAERATSSLKTPTKTNKQPATSDFALWVGNLPQRTSLLQLCSLFGSPEIISIYLIQRTGCAFVNYSTSDALEEAMELFLARGGKIKDHKLVIKAQRKASGAKVADDVKASQIGVKNRYFICKSLSVDDLDTARKTGKWSTQTHNLAKFNEAFLTSENVYFIFSANRTSLFYGYARMESLIPEGVPAQETDPMDAACRHASTPEEELQIQFVPAYSAEGVQYPAGRIVQDGASGALFWEALDYEGQGKKDDDAEQWTSSCSVRWISNGNQVSFSRTRNMRNSLNSNKPVKIARDGTELETGLGEQLCALFSNP